MLAALVALFAGQRQRGPLAHAGAVWGRVQGPRWAWAFAYAAALAACTPIFLALPTLFTAQPVLLGDAASHAAIARQIAKDGLPHGWVDVYNGGFPFGVHYQSVGYLLVAGITRLGVDVAHAMQGVGVAATIALTLAVVHAARTLGAHPAIAVAGAWMATWVAPANTFIGGWETYVIEGLLAQSLALPLAVLAMTAMAFERSRWKTPVFAALLMTTHPQIATGVLAVLTPAFFVVPNAAWRARFVRGGVAIGLVGLAVYGRGVLSLHVPFGFSGHLEEWKQLGFPFEAIPSWLEGELFDRHRVPAFTAAWLVASIALVVFVRRAVPRAVLVTMLAALMLSACGYSLQHLGVVGKALLAFVMPLRITALLMLLATVAVVVALEEVRVWAAEVRWRSLALLGSALVFFAAFEAPARFDWMANYVSQVATAGTGRGRECLRFTPLGYSTPQARQWLSEIDHGRFTFDAVGGPMGYCPGTHGLELVSRVPLGVCGGAATHLATNLAAFENLRLRDPGAWERAETLGVRAVLHTASESAPDHDGHWDVVHSEGDMRMSVREGGTDLVGGGCITETWRGSDAELRRALNEDLFGPGTLLAHPQELVAIERTQGTLVRERVPLDECDAKNVRIIEKRREPGAFEATVESASRFDVVFRATAFRTWTVTVDDEITPWKMVAPGFFAARVPPGRHRVEAIASWLPAFRTIIALALVCVALLTRTDWPLPLMQRLGRMRFRRRAP